MYIVVVIIKCHIPLVTRATCHPSGTQLWRMTHTLAQGVSISCTYSSVFTHCSKDFSISYNN